MKRIAFSFRIYDEFGKLLILNSLIKENKTIDLSDLPDGLYILHLMENGKSIAFQKIVKL